MKTIKKLFGVFKKKATPPPLPKQRPVTRVPYTVTMKVNKFDLTIQNCG